MQSERRISLAKEWRLPESDSICLLEARLLSKGRTKPPVRGFLCCESVRKRTKQAWPEYEFWLLTIRW